MTLKLAFQCWASALNRAAVAEGEATTVETAEDKEKEKDDGDDNRKEQ